MPRLESRLRGSYLGDSDKPVSQGSVMGEALYESRTTRQTGLLPSGRPSGSSPFFALETRCRRPISVVSAFCGGGLSFSRRRTHKVLERG
jgi:hypothetical protein